MLLKSSILTSQKAHTALPMRSQAPHTPGGAFFPCMVLKSSTLKGCEGKRAVWYAIFLCGGKLRIQGPTL